MKSARCSSVRFGMRVCAVCMANVCVRYCGSNTSTNLSFVSFRGKQSNSFHLLNVHLLGLEAACAAYVWRMFVCILAAPTQQPTCRTAKRLSLRPFPVVYTELLKVARLVQDLELEK